jgi:hypothetical protein
MPTFLWPNYPVTYARTYLHYCAVVGTHSHYRYIQPYLSTFFSLPVKRHSGERLSHEEVVDQLDEQTVSYEIGFGASGMFAETLRVTIRVEVAKYELAVAWLRDLLYGSEFSKERSVLLSCDRRAAVMTDWKGSRSQSLRYNRHYPASSEMGTQFYRPSRQNCCTMRALRLGLVGCLSNQTLSEDSRKRSTKHRKKLSGNSRVSVKPVCILRTAPADSLLTSIASH